VFCKSKEKEIERARKKGSGMKDDKKHFLNENNLKSVIKTLSKEREVEWNPLCNS
jgi:hypothetical protein